MNLRHWLRMHAFLSAKRRLEWFPPFRRMGVKLLLLSDDWREVHLLLPLNRRNRNPGGSMFGGAVAALADPIPALACNQVFPGNAVWTRELHVDFRRPGEADLQLRFTFKADIEQRVATELEHNGRSTPRFEFGFYLPNGDISAWVCNRVAIRPMGQTLRGNGALGETGKQSSEK